MPKILGVREMTNEESTTLDRLSRWQTAPARQVERAKMVQWVKETDFIGIRSIQDLLSLPLDEKTYQSIHLIYGTSPRYVYR